MIHTSGSFFEEEAVFNVQTKKNFIVRIRYIIYNTETAAHGNNLPPGDKNYD